MKKLRIRSYLLSAFIRANAIPSIRPNSVPILSSYNKDFHTVSCMLQCNPESLTSKQHASTSSIVQKFGEVLETKNLQLIFEHPACELCMERLSQLSDEELFKVIRIMDNLYRQRLCQHRERKRTLRQMLLSVDAECGTRGSERWSLPFMIEILDNTFLFGKIRGKRKSRFLSLFSARRFVEAFKLEPALLIRYLRIINQNFYWDIAHEFITNRYNLEFVVDKYLNDLSFDDLRVIFRAHNLLSYTTNVMYISKDELLPKIVEKVLNNLTKFNDLFLKEFLFFINRQIFIYTYEEMTPLVSRLVDHLEEIFDEISLECLCFASKLCTKFLLYRPQFLEKIFFRLMNEYSFKFVEAFEQAVRSMAFFNFNTPKADVYQELLKFLEREETKEKFFETHPKRFARVVTYLTYVGLYSTDFANLLLSKEFLSKTYGKLGHHNVHRHILRLDFGVDIECPDYTGNRLPTEFREKFANFLIDNLPKNCYFREGITFEANYKIFPSEHAAKENVLYNRTMEDASLFLNKAFGGDEYTHVCRILPHWPGKNLIFCANAKKTVQRLNSSIKNNRRLDLNELDTNLLWYVLVCSSRNRYCDGEAMVVGKEIPKVRQLKRLGFRVLNVVHEDWDLMDGDEKLNVLRTQISNN